MGNYGMGKGFLTCEAEHLFFEAVEIHFHIGVVGVNVRIVGKLLLCVKSDL